MFLNLYLDKHEIDSFNVFSLIYLFSIIIISFYYLNFFNSNIRKIINIFIFLFLISSFSNFFEYKYDVPYFCGGVGDIFNLINYENEDILRSHQVRLSFKEYIFQENSHLGMVAPGLITFLIYYLSTKRVNLLYTVYVSIFFILCFLKGSTTLLMGTTISLIFLLFFNYSQLNKKSCIMFTLIILLFSSVLLTNKECNSRFMPFLKNFTINKFLKPNLVKGIEEPRDFFANPHYLQVIKDKFHGTIYINDKQSETINLSSKIYMNSLLVLKNSILEKPLGWGINRFIDAFKSNIENYKKDDETEYYNTKDGTNNFVKIFVEFGIFGIVFYFFVFLFLLNKKIPIDLKLFYLPIIFSQSIRGAGYFNGGFILIAFLMLFTYIEFNKKLK